MHEKKCYECVNMVNQKGLAPVHLAVLSESMEIVDTIVQLKELVDLNLREATYGYSALHFAAMHSRNTPMVNLLARCENINLNVRSFNDDTPLHFATANKNYMATICLVIYSYKIIIDVLLSNTHVYIWI